MRRRVWIIWLVLLALVAGCAGGSSKPSNYGSYSSYGGSQAKTSSGEAPSSPAPSPYGGSYDNSEARSYSPPSTTSTGRAEEHVPTPSQPPRERPGLGTEWGESRSSRVRDTQFFRSESDRPFAVATLHYNDRSGVEALANFHGARGPRFREYSARGGAITIAIRDGSGDSLEALHLGDRTYVIGQAGDRYSIVMTNHTGHRYEVVTTVDGLDVINGHTGNLQNRGYVLMPYATLEIDGFRQSQDAVAAFRFGRVSDSYAAQTGSARNVGVIGMAFFAERGDYYSDEELGTRDSANPFPGSDPRFARPPSR